MKKQILLGIWAVLGLSACVVEKEAVGVAEGPNYATVGQTSTFSESKAPVVPSNATAICRDGSYSVATDNSACAGNGGVATSINRYHSE